MMNNKPDLVPKVHPMAREIEQNDPMELIATPVQGDPEFMLECLVEEYVWMGWDAEALLAVFHSPEYPVLNQLLAYFGEADVRRRIETLLGQSGSLRFCETIAPDVDPEEEHEPELLQLSTERVVKEITPLSRRERGGG